MSDQTQQDSNSAAGGASALTVGLGELLKLKSLAIWSHYSCDDCWYSCPKSEDGCCNEAEGDECNCGADKHNAEVEALFQAMARKFWE